MLYSLRKRSPSPHSLPPPQANIRAKRRAEFRQQLQERPSEDVSEAAFFDPRVSLRPSVRGRRAFNFHEPGRFQQVAARMRTKAQLEKLQVRQRGGRILLVMGMA